MDFTNKKKWERKNDGKVARNQYIRTVHILMGCGYVANDDVNGDDIFNWNLYEISVIFFHFSLSYSVFLPFST